jgi:hypothetical protein
VKSQVLGASSCDRNEDDVLASSEQRVDDKLQMTLLCNAVGKKIY